MDRLQERRVWLLGGVLAAVLIIAISWLMFIGPELSSTASLRSQAAATRQENTLLGFKVDSLRAKSKNVRTYTTALARALDALPPTSGLPSFTREVAAHAATTGVTVSSISIGGVTAATTSNASGSPSTTTAPTTTPTTPTTTASGTTTAGTTGAAPAGGLYAISVSLQTSGTLAHQLAFLERLRTVGPRSVLITSTQFAPASGAKASSIAAATTMTASLSVFTAPMAPAQLTQLQNLLSGKIGN